MKVMLFGLILSITTLNCFAQPNFAGKVFEGREVVNGHSTGKTCQVSVNEVYAIESTANCFSTTFSVQSPALGSMSDLKVRSRFTNQNLPSFKERKSCAMTLENEVAEDEILIQDNSRVYTPSYGGSHSVGGKTYDQFLYISPETLEVKYTSIHVMSTFSEKTVECWTQ